VLGQTGERKTGKGPRLGFAAKSPVSGHTPSVVSSGMRGTVLGNSAWEKEQKPAWVSGLLRLGAESSVAHGSQNEPRGRRMDRGPEKRASGRKFDKVYPRALLFGKKGKPAIS